MTAGTPEHRAGRIEQALAEDPRTHELGIQAEVRGDAVYLRGQVVGNERRQLVSQVTREVAPELIVRNEVSVAEVKPPRDGEALG